MRTQNKSSIEYVWNVDFSNEESLGPNLWINLIIPLLATTNVAKWHKLFNLCPAVTLRFGTVYVILLLGELPPDYSLWLPTPSFHVALQFVIFFSFFFEKQLNSLLCEYNTFLENQVWTWKNRKCSVSEPKVRTCDTQGLFLEFSWKYLAMRPTVSF